MITVKRRIFSGAVCEQEVYNIAPKTLKSGNTEPRPRFANEEERAEHREKISRQRHARLFNENFSPAALYSTLTFDDENEVHTFDDAGYILDLYIRRLKYKFPDAVIFAYKGRGKNTQRIHFHMVSTGVPEEYIVKQWRYGTVLRIVGLREHNYYNGIDHGQDYTGLANYLFDHWTPEQGGKRWKMTRNALQPEREQPTIASRRYSESKPPKAPKGYKLVESRSTRYGYLYFKYVLDVPPAPRKKKRADF